MVNSIKEIWKKYELGFYCSIAGSLIMGTIHLVSTIISFSWLLFNYMLIAKTKHSESQYEGIRIVDIGEWLNNSK